MTREFVDITVTIRVEVDDIKEAIELVEMELGEGDTLSVGWPTIEKAELQRYD